MLMMVLLRMGSLVNFISHPVFAGFTSDAALLNIGCHLPQLADLKTISCDLDASCYRHYLQGFNPATFTLELIAISLLIFFGKSLSPLLKKANVSFALITAISKCGPLLIAFLTTFAANHFNLHMQHMCLSGR